MEIPRVSHTSICQNSKRCKELARPRGGKPATTPEARVTVGLLGCFCHARLTAGT